MEMQKILPENKTTYETASEVLVEATTQEEAEPAYDILRSPTEDVYADTGFDSPVEKTKGQQVEGNERLYRCGCFVLTGICLVLLLIVIFLGLKLGTRACDIQECHNEYITNQYKHLGCQQCAKGWLPYGKSCYFLSTMRLSWADSQKNCSSSGGSLAVISSRSVQRFLTTTGNLQYWIGLKQDSSEWNWVNSDHLQESYWATSTGKGDCATLSGQAPEERNWGKASCQSLTYFICQLQL